MGNTLGHFSTAFVSGWVCLCAGAACVLELSNSDRAHYSAPASQRGQDEGLFCQCMRVIGTDFDRKASGGGLTDCVIVS